MSIKSKIVHFVGPNNVQAFKKDYVSTMDTISNSIYQKAKKSRKKTNPILLIDEQPLIYPRTINVIQGRSGTHKSRIAEAIAASFLNKAHSLKLLTNGKVIFELERSEVSNNYRVIYIDTERDQDELLPETVRSIKRWNHTLDDKDFNDAFTLTSILTISRENRLKALSEYLQRESAKIGKDQSTKLIVVLDVISDFLLNFNDLDSSNELLDILNNLINSYGVTFICVIHENPDGFKARGHLGTEITNKASTVLQVALQNKKNVPEHLKITCLKSRSSEKFKPIYLKYDSEASCLTHVSLAEILESKDPKKIKGGAEEIVRFLEKTIEADKEYSKNEIFFLIENELKIKSRTIEARIKEISEKQLIFRIGGESYLLGSYMYKKFKKYKLERKI